MSASIQKHLVLYNEILFHNADYINLPHLAPSEFGAFCHRYVCSSHDSTHLSRQWLRSTLKYLEENHIGSQGDTDTDTNTHTHTDTQCNLRCLPWHDKVHTVEIFDWCCFYIITHTHTHAHTRTHTHTHAHTHTRIHTHSATCTV